MLSWKLAEFIRNLRYDDLPDKTVHCAKLALLDWLGSAARGGTEKPAEIARRVLQLQGGSAQATLLATGEKTSVLNAALGNGIASHIVELDDVHRGSIIHTGAVVIPAALAVSEMKRAGGRELIESIVAGYEVAIRIGEAVTPSHYYFWHNTGTCGTFGACAAAGKLLDLNGEQLVWAIGNAGTQAAGLWEFMSDGAMSKHLHPGKAAQNGLLAALLAEGGFTGATAILEGERGFCRATAPQFDLEKISVSLGTAPYKVEDNSYKIHSSCRHTHPSIDIVLDLASRHRIRPPEITAVDVRTYKTALDIAFNGDPQSVYAAKFSIQFCIALALYRGGCRIEDFSEANLRDPEIRALMSRVKVVLDDGLNSIHPAKWAATISITTGSGDVVSGRTDFPLGDPENPASDEMLLAKFRGLATGAWGQQKVDSLAESVMALEKVKDVAALF